MPTLFVRHEAADCAGKFDLHGYTNESCTRRLCVWEWYHFGRPIYRQRGVRLNGYHYRLIWVGPRPERRFVRRPRQLALAF